GMARGGEVGESGGGIGGVGQAEARVERVEHLLYPLRGAFLLLDEVLESETLLLQVAVGLFQLRAVAKQRQHPVVFFERDLRGTQAEFEKAELSQRLHERCGGRPPLLMRRRVAPCGMRSDDLAPRSTPATCLTSCYGPSADPVHAPARRAARAAGDATAAPRRDARHGRCARACPDTDAGRSPRAGGR